MATTLLLGFVSTVQAQTAYVDNTLSGPCETYDVASRACGTGSNRAYASFDGASRAAQPGSVFKVRGGRYQEVLHLRISGTVEAPIVWQAQDNERVVIAEVDSIDEGEEYGPIWLDGVSWNVISGFRITESVGFLRAVSSHHNVIEENEFDTSWKFPSQSKRGGMYFSGSNYNVVRNNVILRGTDSLALIASNHNVVENNRFEDAGHDLWNIKCGSNNVIRGNHFDNPSQKIGSVFDCESATMRWAGNGDLARNSAVLDATKQNLIERNTFSRASSYYSSSGGNGIQYAGQNGIIRNNIFTNTNAGLVMAHYDSEALYTYGNRVYHNVFHNNQCAGIVAISADGDGRVADNVFVNNALWDNKGWGYDGGCEDTTAAQILYRNGPFKGHFFSHNAVASPMGREVIRDEFGDGDIVSAFSRAMRKTLEAEPRFVDAAMGDYRLAANSPLIDAGRALTEARERGTDSTTLAVDDATYFYDGWGIPGETGDVVCVKANACSRVVGIDYANHVLILAEALSWRSGAGVSLAYSGSSPDIGAFEYQAP